jgi:hypothetical protein
MSEPNVWQRALESWKSIRSIMNKLLWGFLFVGITMMASCQTDKEEKGEHSRHEDGHEDGHHGEHEHFPPHWPKDFLELSDRLKLIADNPSGTKSKARTLEQELTDLIDWLPEFLADSDVSEAEFNRVDTWAFPLASEFKKSVATNDKIDAMIQHELFRKGLPFLVELATDTRKRLAEEKAREVLEQAEAKRRAEMESQLGATPTGDNQ